MIGRGTAAMAAASAIGVWLYVAPGVLGYEDGQATSDRVAGALVTSFSFVAIWEFMRGLRVVARPLGAWLALSVVIFQPPVEAVVSTVLSGLAVVALSFVRGDVERPYGGGWRAILDRRKA